MRYMRLGAALGVAMPRDRTHVTMAFAILVMYRHGEYSHPNKTAVQVVDAACKLEGDIPYGCKAC
jgi:hypothetical protein